MTTPAVAQRTAAPLALLLAALLPALAGCVSLAPSTQAAMGRLRGERDAGVMYARAAKAAAEEGRPGIDAALAEAFDRAAVETDTILNTFSAAVDAATTRITTAHDADLERIADEWRMFQSRARAQLYPGLRPQAADPLSAAAAVLVHEGIQAWAAENRRRRAAIKAMADDIRVRAVWASVSSATR